MDSERPLFSQVGRPTPGVADARSRTLYLVMVLVLVSAGIVAAMQIRGQPRLTVVEVDLGASPAAP